jgi:hypothetical protein
MQQCLPAALDLLLVGAPTHAFSMPSSQSRRDAARQGASLATTGVGVRDWIARVTPRPDLPLVTFDTSVKLRFTPGTAAKATRKALARRGFARAERGPSFYVTGTPGAASRRRSAAGEAVGRWACRPGPGVAGRAHRPVGRAAARGAG